MTGLRSARFPLSAIDVQLYRFCEDFSQALIYFQIVFSPWAFGTTQPWSIRIMNGAGFLLGLALLLKLAVRFLKGYRPLRWDSARSIGAKMQDASPNEALPAKAFTAPTSLPLWPFSPSPSSATASSAPSMPAPPTTA